MVNFIEGEKRPGRGRNLKVAGTILFKILPAAVEEAGVVDGVVDQGELIPGDVHLGDVQAIEFISFSQAMQTLVE